MNLINKLKHRRSYREFERSTFDIQILIDAIEAVKYAPSGANKQPWFFCIIRDHSIKKQIRIEAEKIENKFYENISNKWQSDLIQLNVNVKKPFLENAPYLIVIFKQIYQVDESGNRTNVYFPDKSVGIATGMLIALLTDLDIDILTYTPSPNLFLKDILKRPDNERPYLVLVCGKGSKTYKLPNITKKSNDKVMKIY